MSTDSLRFRRHLSLGLAVVSALAWRGLSLGACHHRPRHCRRRLRPRRRGRHERASHRDAGEPDAHHRRCNTSRTRRSSSSPASTAWSYLGDLLSAPIAPSLGTIDSTGIYTAVGAFGGVASVTATYQGATGSTSVTLEYVTTQNGDTVQLHQPRPDRRCWWGTAASAATAPAARATSTQLTVLGGTPTADPSGDLALPLRRAR